MQRLFVIKIGGNVIDDERSLHDFLKDFASIWEPKILVHGGGKIATKIGEQLGIPSKYVNGRRITDRQTLDLVTMVYAGLINKQIVSHLQSINCNAFGVTGADGNLIKGTKRPVADNDFGFVGDVNDQSVHAEFLSFLLNQNVVPVFAPLTHGNGTMLNTNADTIASVLANALSHTFEVRLVFCFEKKGVLKDVGDKDSVIHLLNEAGYLKLKAEGAFADGIQPKLENAFTSIHAGVKEVLIGDARDLLRNTGQETEGTLITR